MPDEPRPQTDRAQAINGLQARAMIREVLHRAGNFPSFDQIEEMAQEIIDFLVPPVRRQVAEEIARAIEAKKPSASQFWDSADAAHVYAYNAAAKVAREIGERHA